jgi:hypothetical protein
MLAFPVWPSLNGLMTAITCFMSFPLTVRACCAQTPAVSTKLRRAKSKPPREQCCGPRNQTACQVARMRENGGFRGETWQIQTIEAKAPGPHRF